jgi:hypothetical protein
MDFEAKYLKYKMKYLNLNKMSGGMLALQSRQMVEKRELERIKFELEKYGVSEYSDLYKNISEYDNIQIGYIFKLLKLNASDFDIVNFLKNYNYSQLNRLILSYQLNIDEFKIRSMIKELNDDKFYIFIELMRKDISYDRAKEYLNTNFKLEEIIFLENNFYFLEVRDLISELKKYSDINNFYEKNIFLKDIYNSFSKINNKFLEDKIEQIIKNMKIIPYDESYGKLLDQEKAIILSERQNYSDLSYGRNIKTFEIEGNNICIHNNPKVTIGEIVELFNTYHLVNNIFPEIINLFDFRYESKQIGYYNFPDNEFKQELKSLKEHINYFLKNNSFNTLSKKVNDIKKVIIPPNYIPMGRINMNREKINYLLRDMNYFINLNKILMRINLENKLIINYTGHVSSFISALLNYGIDFRFHLPGQVSIYFDWIMNQFQDIFWDVQNKNITNNTSLGIVGFSPHGRGETWDITKMPTIETILEYQFDEILVFTEDHFKKFPFEDYNREFLNKKSSFNEFEKNNSLTNYLYELMNHIPVTFYGINEKESKYADFKCNPVS